MGTAKRERWDAASGYLVILLGVVGAAFERGGPPAGAPAAQALAFFSNYRRELIAQSLAFVLSAGAYLWFFGSLRSALRRAEPGTATLSAIAFGAGLVWVAVQMVFQGVQVGLVMAARTPVEPSVAALATGLLWALSVIGYVPLAVALAAVAIASLRYGALPSWIAWLSAAVAAAHVLMFLGLAADNGPLVPGGPLTFVLYGILLLWLFSITTVLVRAGQRRPVASVAAGGLGVLLASALVVVLPGCQHDPYAHSFTTEKPQPSAVAGHYVLAKQTVVSGGLSAMQGRPCVVDLAPDGTFTATNVPPYERGAPPISSLDALVSGSGTWRLDAVGSVAGGFRKERIHWGVLLESRGRFMQPAGLTGQQPPHGLIFTIGDGGAGTVMILERESPAPGTRGDPNER